MAIASPNAVMIKPCVFRLSSSAAAAKPAEPARPTAIPAPIAAPAKAIPAPKNFSPEDPEDSS